MSARMRNMGTPRMLMLVTGPIVGIVSGIVLGLLSAARVRAE